MEAVHDDFADGLPLNYEEMGIAAPNLGSVALHDVSLPANVINLDDYRNARETPEAA
jgi:hypothetical protein